MGEEGKNTNNLYPLFFVTLSELVTYPCLHYISSFQSHHTTSSVGQPVSADHVTLTWNAPLSFFSCTWRFSYNLWTPSERFPLWITVNDQCKVNFPNCSKEWRTYRNGNAGSTFSSQLLHAKIFQNGIHLRWRYWQDNLGEKLIILSRTLSSKSYMFCQCKSCFQRWFSPS